MFAAEDFADLLVDDPTATEVKMRKAVVTAVSYATHTATVRFGGSTTDVAGVPALNSYLPVVGDVVQVLRWGTSLLIIGSLATSTAYNPVVQQIATLTTSNSIAAVMYGPMINVQLAISIAAGTGTAGANITITTPTNIARATNNWALSGSGWVVDFGTNVYPVMPVIANNVSIVLRRADAPNAGTFVGVDPSFGLVSGDSIHIAFSYEPA
jgi:hypothetical protein